MTIPEDDRDLWRERAEQTYAALLRHYLVGERSLFRERVPPLPTDRRFAYLWPFGQAFAATLLMANLPDERHEALSLARLLWQSCFEHYWDTRRSPPGGASYILPHGGDLFYDDNLWIGLNLIDLYDLTQDQQAIRDARRIFRLAASTWDDDEERPAPGGLFWAEATANPTRDRGTVSNAPAAELALHLYRLTGEPDYLDWGERLFAWVERHLRDPDDDLYWDHIQLDGLIEQTKWSYNQGAMLGAAALLARATDDEALLRRARQIARGALDYYADEDRLWKHEPIFNAIFFRNLHLLDPTTATYRRPLVDYATRAWTSGRDLRRGLVHFGRRGPVDLLHQAAAVQLFALLCL